MNAAARALPLFGLAVRAAGAVLPHTRGRGDTSVPPSEPQYS